MLALAVSLAGYPLLTDLPLSGEARSRTCGSTLSVGLACDSAGRIERLGLRVAACAVGQASAALFARAAVGSDASHIAATLAEFERWLADEGPLPDWPELAILEPARAYPGRHGAILLPWIAAHDALSKLPARS
ncbi:iron-sulfur cluster assembly scaffold protein [Tsuneonella suprasediminis]|uniref:Iron-sulfur cluster assembly scaffold protein n=1 Tax=Tsuneonella suprasediminis TaxID=2306996 RepID=A0A419R002_9SPHN|nr:iron-sulfur cluster assembly scaffold protein [Tsuneonella suprasediminis]